MIKGTGQLRHRFHGTYSAVIVIELENDGDAAKVLALPSFNKFKIEKNVAETIFWVGNKSELDSIKLLLESVRVKSEYRGDEDIDSLNKSIDYGPIFKISIDDSRQQTSEEK
jgi:hypothetical protein